MKLNQLDIYFLAVLQYQIYFNSEKSCFFSDRSFNTLWISQTFYIFVEFCCSVW